MTKLFVIRAALADCYQRTLAGVPVFDGPVARKTMPARCVLVGTDGGENGTGEGTGDGSRAILTRDSICRDSFLEDGEIVCALWGWSGSTDLTPLRETAATDAYLLMAAIVSDAAVLAALGPGATIQTRELKLWEAQRPEGAVIRASFVVAYYQARVDLT